MQAKAQHITPHQSSKSSDIFSASFQERENESRSSAQQQTEKGGAVPTSKVGFNFGNIPLFASSTMPIQPKLKINTPGDKYEQEADRMADQIMRMPAPNVQRKCTKCGAKTEEESIQRTPLAAQISPVIQRKCAKCEEEDEKHTIQTKAAGQTPSVASPSLSSRIQNTKGHGQAMDASTNEFMSSRFGTDFSGVRVHTDSGAAAMNREINARAFTVGRDVYFGGGQYSPNSGEGKRLLTHELVHVVQQGGQGGRISRKTDEDGFEQTPHPNIVKEAPRLAAIGEDILHTVGYEALINKARENNLLPKTDVSEEQSIAGASGVIQRQGFAEAFAPFATTALITSQLDSPAPGPADLVALGILAVGLIAAGVIVATSSTTRTCPPCPSNPAPEIDRVPPSTPHWPCPGDHWHYHTYNQNPVTCQCFPSGRKFGGCCGHIGAPC